MGNGTLRATQPAALIDPFECAFRPGSPDFDDTGDSKNFANALTEINPYRPVTSEDVHNAKLEYGSLFAGQLFARQVSTRFGIVSFSEDPLHPLMWSHYTTDGSGFVIGYDVDELRRLAVQHDYLQKVNYSEKLRNVTAPIVLVCPESNFPITLSYKSDHWSYEREWRLIVKLDGTIGTGLTDQRDQPINLVQVPNEAVVKVYYTERTSSQTVDQIRERLGDPNNRYHASNLCKLVLSSERYAYEVVEEAMFIAQEVTLTRLVNLSYRD